MTILKSRLVTPDGKAIVGRKITATLMYRPSWISTPDKGGRALGTVTGYTDFEGVWRIELMPVTQFEEPDYVWYQIDEGSEQTWRVRFDEADGEVWLKDKLIDPPPPAPDYIAIDKLGSLHDVDRESVEGAPNGSILIKRDGKWTAEMPIFGKELLSELRDVDAASVSAAKTGDTFEYLGDSHGWGVAATTPPVVGLEGAFADPGAEVDPSGMTVRLTLTRRDPEKTVHVSWGDSTSSELGPAQQTVDHLYDWTRTYAVSASYDDDSSRIDDMIDIPYSRTRSV